MSLSPHIRYLDSLSHKENKLVYRIHFAIRTQSAWEINGLKMIPWTIALKDAIRFHRQVRKAQEPKRIKNKTRNS